MKLPFEGFEHPKLLPLLLAAFLPIALAILDRRRAKLVDWPAVRFLLVGSRSRMRRWRIREALLVATRSLLLLGAALAIAGPFGKRTVSVPEALAPRDAVLAVDSSWSMTYRDDEDAPSCLELAREAALRVLDGLRAGDRAAAIFPAANEVRQTRIGEPSAAREALSSAAPGPRPFRLLEAIERALALLPEEPGRTREIYVFSDLQASALPEGDVDRLRIAREASSRRGGPLRLKLIDCGAPSPSNRFVVSIRVPPLAAGTDERTAFRAEIEWSPAQSAGMGPGEAPSELPVALLSNGLEVESVRKPFPRDRTASVELEHLFESGGTVCVSVAIPEDGLAADDRGHIALEVLDSTEVLIIGPSARRGSARAGALRDADYLDLALAPRLRGEPEPKTIFRTRLEETLPQDDLSGYRVVAIAGLRKMDRETAEAMESFVRRGGGLLVFAGPAIDAASWAEEGFRAGRGFLPARPAIERGNASPPLHPRDVALSHPALSIFSGGEEGDLSLVRIASWTKFGDLAPGATVLANADEGSPWIVEGRLGAGKVIAVGTAAAPGDSDLPRTPLFVPLVHRLARYLAAGDSSAQSALVGDVLSLELPIAAATSEAKAVLPSGAERPAAVDVEGGRLVARFSGTDAPGFYELRVEDPPISRTFAVNVPASESRLDRIPDAELARLRDEVGLEIARHPKDLQPSLETREEKRDYRPALLLAVLALAFLDLVLSRGFAAEAQLGAARAWTPA